eukprot:s2667_g1.t1
MRFNLLDFTGERSAFGKGLPVADKNRGKWDMMRPLLRDPRLQPTPEMARATIAKFCELLAIRKSTALFGLRPLILPLDILTKVKFPGCGRHQVPGVVMMEVTNGRAAAGPNAGLPLCDQYARVVVVFSSRPSPAGSCTGTLQLHPLQASSTDERTRQAFVDEEKDELFVPALSAIVFVEPLPGRDGYKAHPLKRNFSCAVVSSIRERAAGEFGLPESHVEPLQLVRYRAGEFYAAHDSTLWLAGQRVATLLVYLTEPRGDATTAAGGETRFTQLDVNVPPKPGVAILWPNVSQGGIPLEQTEHEALPHRSDGIKVALNIWLRERPLPRHW